MRETDAILQSILYQLKKEKEFGKGSLSKGILSVEAMCSKENLDAVEALLAKERAQIEE